MGLAWAAQATVTATYTVWTWNVAGWAIHRGSATDALVPTLSSSVQTLGAPLVTLNELCEGQYRALLASLRAAGWPDDPTNFARFEPHGPTDCGGQAFGDAILSKAPLGAASRSSSPRTGPGRAPAPVRSPGVAPTPALCPSHITPETTLIDGQRITETQLNEVHSRLESFNTAGDTVLFAGDLNSQPHDGRLNRWYSPAVATAHNASNTGAYRELDDTDLRCAGRRDDDPRDRRGPVWPVGEDRHDLRALQPRRRLLLGRLPAHCVVRRPPRSDHRILLGTVRVSVG